MQKVCLVNDFFFCRLKKDRLTKNLIMINVVQYTKRAAHLFIGFFTATVVGISRNENEACGL